MIPALRTPGRHQVTWTAVALAVALGCGRSDAIAPIARPVPSPVESRAFEQWLAGFRERAQSAGIPEPVLECALTGLTPDEAVLEADRNQPESTKQPWDYLSTAVSRRVTEGRRLMTSHRKVLHAAARRYGVPAETLAAVWGVESSYGKRTGDHLAIQALATLAFDGRRREFFEEELLAALRILRDGDTDPAQMHSSWAGALGQTQFMPSSYLDYAVDGDGDGDRDLWKSLPDVFASIANYLHKQGWKSGQRWGLEVRLPPGFDLADADGETRRQVAAWSEMSVTRLDGKVLANGKNVRNDMEGVLFLPAGHRGPALLLFANFDAFLAYNPGHTYALALGYLSDALATGVDAVARTRWPIDEPALTLEQRKELQELLLARGIEIGEPDGVVGRRTRSGLRQFQRSIGEPPDGFPTVRILERLRNPGTS